MLCYRTESIYALFDLVPDEKLPDFVHGSVYDHEVPILRVLERHAAPVDPAMEFAWRDEQFQFLLAKDKPPHDGLDRDERFQAVYQF